MPACTPTPRVVLGIDWTVATVFGEPPPNMNVDPPSVAPDASWNADARDGPLLLFAVTRSSVFTPLTEVPAEFKPPITVRDESPPTTTSRDTGEPSCHDSTPASIEGI